MEKLSRDEKRGLVLEDSKRVLTFRISTFQALIDRLIGMAGAKVGKTILYQLGNEIGQTGLRYSKDRIVADNLVKVFDSVLRARGWGRVLSLEKKHENSVYVFTTADCPICYERSGRVEPICDLMRSVLAGWKPF